MSQLFFKIEEAAKVLSCSTRTIRRMIKCGTIGFIEVGVGSRKSIRVKLPEVQVVAQVGARKKYKGKVLDRA